MLKGEENQKAVDEASAVASGMEEGSCGRAPTQGQQLTRPRGLGDNQRGKKESLDSRVSLSKGGLQLGFV